MRPEPEPTDDVFAVVREVGEVNRLIREGLAAWYLVDAREVFRERLAAVEYGDSPAPRTA